MVQARNPFTPGFGQQPPRLEGRGEYLAKFARTLAWGPAVPEFTSLLLGPRGVGKTTVLAAAAQEARAAGWTVISIGVTMPTAPDEDKMLSSIRSSCREAMDELIPPSKRAVTGFSVPLVGGGVTWQTVPEQDMPLRRQLGLLVDAVVQQGGAGVLLTLDEFHNATAAEASVLAMAIQQLVKIEQKPLAFVGTGLPYIEYVLLDEQGFTFFQRCHRERIENIAIDEASAAIRIPLEEHGVHIDKRELRRVAGGTRGLCFAVQSVGHHLWELCGGPGATITTQHATEAIKAMIEDVNRYVALPVWNRLSHAGRRFLMAMSKDTGASQLKDIAHRLGWSGSTTSEYKKKLLQEGAILEHGHRHVIFASGTLRYRALAEADMLRVMEAEFKRESTVINTYAVPPRMKAPRCGAPMKRSGVPCKRRQDHPGPHRST